MNTILFVGEHAKTYDVQWHSHEQWELVYCTDGDGAFKFENGSTIEYRKGQVVAIPPRERHANSSNDGFTNLHIRMSDPSFPYRSAFRVDDDAENHLKIAFTEAKFYSLADIRKRELVLAALGDLIASYMIVYRSNNEFSQPVEKIRSLIINNYADSEFALDEAIRAMPFHYDYLRKLFKKEMGLTPLEYMTQLRMKKAEMMLTAMWSSDYSIAEIGALCGFGDALYFSRVFKKHFGYSPSEFAKSREMASQETKEP